MTAVGLLAAAAASCASTRAHETGPTTPATVAAAGPTSTSALAPAATTIPTATSTATTVAPTTITMAFSGDILVHRPLVAQALRYGNGSYQFAPMFARIAPLLSSVDLAVCHLETPVAPPGEAISGFPVYGVPREVVAGIASAGFDRCTTASNHSLDRGLTGIDATVNELEAAGIGNVGMARTPAEAEPQVFVVKGVPLAQLDYTFGLGGRHLPADQPWRVRFLDADRIVADARLARERGAQYVIVNLHWGQEKSWRVTTEQRTLAETLTASGAIDLVVGEHVHVLQPIEQVNGHWVVYGTGDLLSNLPGGDTSFPASTQDGAVVMVSVTRGADGTFATARPVVHPTWVDHDGYVIRAVLDDLADPTIPPAVRADLARSLARTRTVVGDFVGA